MATKPQPSPYRPVRKEKKEYLYTKGRQFSLDGQNYIGEYHKVGSNYKTGPVETPNSKLLTKYYNNPIIYEYDKSREFVERVRVQPNQIVWAPIETNYQTGYATRYFVERIGQYEGYPIEIDQIQKARYGKDEGIDEGVYSLLTLQWKLTGPERSIYKDGKLYAQGIYEYNQAQVILGTKIIPNLETAIKSYTEYARITLTLNSAIGKEYNLMSAEQVEKGMVDQGGSQLTPVLVRSSTPSTAGGFISSKKPGSGFGQEGGQDQEEPPV